MSHNAGQSWRTGAGAPAAGFGKIGDFYLDTSSKDVYEKTGTSTWTKRGDISREITNKFIMLNA